MSLTLAVAETILRATLAHARSGDFLPLSVVILDQRAAVVAAASEDGTSLRRFEVAQGKALGALAFNLGSRRIATMAAERPHFFAGVAHAVGAIVPGAGGVLVRDAGGTILGAVGVSGDTADNDEVAALAGIAAAGLVGDGG